MHLLPYMRSDLGRSISIFLNCVVPVRTGEEQKWQDLLLLMKWRVKDVDIDVYYGSRSTWKPEIGNLIWIARELESLHDL